MSFVLVLWCASTLPLGRRPPELRVAPPRLPRGCVRAEAASPATRRR